MMARESLARSRAVVTCSSARQPVGVDEVRARHAEPLGGVVHQVDEVVLIAADGLRQHDGHVVGGLDDEGLQRQVDRQLAADRQADLARRLVVGGGRAGDLRFERQAPALDRLECEVGGHHLGERGGVPLIVGVLRIEDFAAGRLEQRGRGRTRRRSELKAMMSRRARIAVPQRMQIPRRDRNSPDTTFADGAATREPGLSLVL